MRGFGAGDRDWFFQGAPAAGDDQGDKVAEKTVGRHALQAAFEQAAGGKIVGDNAGQINGGAGAQVQVAQQLVSAADDRRPAVMRGVEAQAAEVTDAQRLSVDKTQARGDAAGGDDAAGFDG